MELHVDRDCAAPGSTVAAFGRVWDRARGVPAAGAEVSVGARRDVPLRAPRALVSDEAQ